MRANIFSSGNYGKNLNRILSTLEFGYSGKTKAYMPKIPRDLSIIILTPTLSHSKYDWYNRASMSLCDKDQLLFQKAS